MGVGFGGELNTRSTQRHYLIKICHPGDVMMVCGKHTLRKFKLGYVGLERLSERRMLFKRNKVFVAGFHDLVQNHR